MTYNKLPGIYFNETVLSDVTYNQENVPLFLISTSTAISELDEKVVEFTSYDKFKEIVTGKVNNNLLTYVSDILTESGLSKFYACSTKQVSSNDFSNTIKNTAHLDDITSIIYIEDSKTGNFSLKEKITCIINALKDNAENGVFREAYVIPLATVTSAISAAEDTAPEVALITSMTDILEGKSDGRICVVIPDSMAGVVVGKCISTDYNEEVGYTQVSLLKTDNLYDFDYNQMLTLQNLGVMFIRPEKIQGTTQHRINLGVTTNFKENKADGLLICRTIVDELLRRIKWECQPIVKDKESESNLADAESVITDIIDEFAKNEDIKRDETNLTVTEKDDMTFLVSGQIKPTRSIVAIEVNTTIA